MIREIEIEIEIENRDDISCVARRQEKAHSSATTVIVDTNL